MRRRSIIGMGAMALVAAAIGGCDSAAPPATTRVLLDRELPVSDFSTPQAFSLTDPQGGYRLVEISQGALDVQLDLRAGGERQRFDAQGTRAGPERGCLFAPA